MILRLILIALLTAFGGYGKAHATDPLAPATRATLHGSWAGLDEEYSRAMWLEISDLDKPAGVFVIASATAAVNPLVCEIEELKIKEDGGVRFSAICRAERVRVRAEGAGMAVDSHGILQLSFKFEPAEEGVIIGGHFLFGRVQTLVRHEWSPIEKDIAKALERAKLAAEEALPTPARRE